jgi:hypothetical protein
MSESLETLWSLCCCLKPGGNVPALSNGQWQQVIDLANLYYLTPALAWTLEQKKPTYQMPADAWAFLEGALDLNRSRNKQIRLQALEVTGALAAAGIRPVILKGGVCLFEEGEEAFNSRMMVDLDILVAEDQLPSALDVAAGLNYEVLGGYNERSHDIKCKPRSGDRVMIEIHRFLGPQRTLLPPETVMCQATLLETGSSQILIPSLSHRVLHNIFHAQVQNRGHVLGRVSLRGLHDLGLLLKSESREVNWPAIEDAMVTHGYGKALWSYLYAGQRLLDLPITLHEAHAQRAQRHFRRSMRQIQFRRLQIMVDLLGALSHPFNRPLIEYLYGPSKSSASLNLKRCRHAFRMIRKHNYKSISKIFEIRRLFYR